MDKIINPILDNIFENKNPTAVITFDDGTDGDYLKAYQKLSAKGWSATSYIVPSWVGDAGRLSVSDIKTMYNNGWEFGSHTYNHVHYPNLTEQEIINDITNVNDYFSNTLGIPEPNSFCYPYGDNNDITDNIVKDYYQTYRDTYYNYYSYQKHRIDFTKALKGVVIDATTDEEFNAVKRQIENCVLNNGIIILYGHEVGGGISETYFDEYINLLDEHNFDVITMSELYERLQ